MGNKFFIFIKDEFHWQVSFLGLKISHKITPPIATNVSGINNRIFIIHGEKRVIQRKAIPNLNIQINGNNNIIELNYPISNIKNSQIIISGDNNYVKIGCSQYLIENTILDMRVWGYNRKICIGEHFSSNGAVLWNEENDAEIIIGDDVMFGHNIFVRNSDGHLIFDKFGKHINRANKIIIGNHVWIGSFVNILKNTTISDGSIIGTGSIVTKSTSEPNCIYAGVPAKKIKREIYWDRLTPNLYFQTNKSYGACRGDDEHI